MPKENKRIQLYKIKLLNYLIMSINRTQVNLDARFYKKKIEMHCVQKHQIKKI